MALPTLVILLLGGLLLGATISLTPGPILFLTIAETLARGKKAGMVVFFGMLLVDALIIIPMTLVLGSFMQVEVIQQTVYLMGGVVLIVLGLLTLQGVWRGKQVDQSIISPAEPQVGVDPSSNVRSSFLKAVSTQIVNPLAFLFWVTVGLGQVQAVNNEVSGMGFLYPICFWFGFMSVFIFWVFLTASGRTFLSSRWYLGIQVVCAILLMIFGLSMWLQP